MLSTVRKERYLFDRTREMGQAVVPTRSANFCTTPQLPTLVSRDRKLSARSTTVTTKLYILPRKYNPALMAQRSIATSQRADPGTTKLISTDAAYPRQSSTGRFNRVYVLPRVPECLPATRTSSMMSASQGFCFRVHISPIHSLTCLSEDPECRVSVALDMSV